MLILDGTQELEVLDELERQRILFSGNLGSENLPIIFQSENVIVQKNNLVNIAGAKSNFIAGGRETKFSP